jgi:hypothetical protein
MRYVLASFRTLETCSVVSGKTITSGVTGSSPRSIQNRLMEHTSVLTASRSARLFVTLARPTMSSSSKEMTL